MSTFGSDASGSARNREWLDRFGLRPKKSFGQNFLQDVRVVRRIAEAAAPAAPVTVLELGPGLGVLTEALVARASAVTVVERDRDMIPVLNERFASAKNLEVVEGDAATWPWEKAFEDKPRPWVVTGNLPYQITGRLLRTACEHAHRIDRVVFMVQLEVAERLAATPATKSYGALSVFSQAAFTVELVCKVAPGAFLPAPAVWSAVVSLTARRPAVSAETAMFRQVVSGAFGQRRKTLRNSLKGVAPPDSLAAAATSCGIDLGLRGEVLTVAQFAELARALEKAREGA